MPDREFLLEVRCEEIPARMLAPGIRALSTRFFEELVAANLVPEEVVTGFTPRRLMLCLKGLPEAEPDQREQVIGPPVSVALRDGKPTKALVGFAERCGVDPEAVQQVETEKGLYVAVEQEKKGRRTIEVLAELVPKLLVEMHWPKMMRWGTGVGPWVRPVHGLVALFAGETVSCEIFGVSSGNATSGHPLHSPELFAVSDYESYRDALRERGVEIHFDDRRRILLESAQQRASEVGGRLVDDPALLDKLAAICGIPGLVGGSFDDSYLDLPREVLETSLRDHQSALTIQDTEGRLLPHFLTVMDRADDPEGLVKTGNEWVVVARLADARFFWDEDRRRPLSEFGERLEHLSFHARLGSYAEKRERLAGLVAWLGEQIGWNKDEIAPAARAATLLKADLTTEMVKEFTSLQGVMGGIYAREDGEPDAVWQAIYDQYLPASTSDSLPRSAIGQIVSIADRIDTLAGMFGIGLVPTGSRDPFGLRRAAQGLIRILLEGELAIDPEAAAGEALRRFGDRISADADEVLEQLRPFLQDRIRHLLGLQGYVYDEIEAGLGAGWRDLPDLRARVAAIHAARDQPGFGEVVLAAKRIANILREQPHAELDEDLLQEDAEKELYEAGRQLAGEIADSASVRDYEKGLAAVARFADVLERFFVEVLVMDENPDLRTNRLALLQRTQASLGRIAQLQEIVVDRADEREEISKEDES